jgi:hypothetical protein
MPKPTNTPSRSPAPVATEKKTAPADGAPAVPTVLGSADALTIHRGAAGTLRLAEVIPFRADADLAYYNAMRGRDALLAARPAVEASGFRADWARIDALGSLGLAMAYAASRVDALPRESNEVLDLLREARPLRRVLLSHARTLSLLDRCPAKEVARIEKGTGARDVANDLADLAALYLAHDLVIAGGTVQTGQVRRAEVLGAALIEKIRPASAVRPSRRTADQQSAMALRDRVWTLFVRAYEHIELAAGAVWGRHVNKHLPSLQARAVARKATTKTAAPTG